MVVSTVKLRSLSVSGWAASVPVNDSGGDGGGGAGACGGPASTVGSTVTVVEDSCGVGGCASAVPFSVSCAVADAVAFGVADGET